MHFFQTKVIKDRFGFWPKSVYFGWLDLVLAKFQNIGPTFDVVGPGDRKGPSSDACIPPQEKRAWIDYLTLPFGVCKMCIYLKSDCFCMLVRVYYLKSIMVEQDVARVGVGVLTFQWSELWVCSILCFKGVILSSRSFFFVCVCVCGKHSSFMCLWFMNCASCCQEDFSVLY